MTLLLFFCMSSYLFYISMLVSACLQKYEMTWKTNLVMIVLISALWALFYYLSTH